MERIELVGGWAEVEAVSAGVYRVRVFVGGELVGDHCCTAGELRAALKKLGVGGYDFNTEVLGCVKNPS